MPAPGGNTLEEALVSGQGIERPFRCTEHEDRNASASVNVIKGVWYCHACHAAGKVADKKKAPEWGLLQSMTEPERSPRTYVEDFNLLFAPPGAYWSRRFAPWVVWKLGMGEDPFTGDATFPVHTTKGQFAGVGRRHLDPEAKARYQYPHTWSASTSLFGSKGRYAPNNVIVLVEGPADVAACREVGAPTWGTYGAGLHLPQRSLVMRTAPKLILLGFDMDEAGERACGQAYRDLRRVGLIQRVRWSGKDPAEVSVETRREDLARAVRASGYGVDVLPRWTAFTEVSASEYDRFVEEEGS